MPIDSKLANDLFDEYNKNAADGKGNAATIEKVLGKDADTQEQFQVAAHLRSMAVRLNADPQGAEKSRQEIGSYLAQVSQASSARISARQALEDVEMFKNALLNTELKPGAVTASSLLKSAKQQVDVVGVGTGPQGGSGFATPFSRKFGLKVDSEVAHEIAEIAKLKQNQNFVFTVPLGQLDRNAVMDSVPILKRESRVAEAEFRKAIVGEELSPVQRKAIEKASPVHSSGGRNFLEWTGYNTYEGIKALMPGVFGKEAATDSRYHQYLKFRDEMISKYRGYLSSEESRRYLTGLRNQRNEFAASGAASKLDLAELDKLIAETEKVVIDTNKKDIEKFAETLNQLNTNALAGVEGLTSEEEEMFKLRLFQMALMASPFGFINIIGPFADILAPMLNGNLEFGEGLAQAISNIPFFGDIAEALKLTDLFQFFFDEMPLVSELTSMINEVTDSALMQELGGAASPMMGGPFLALAAAGVSGIYGLNAEVNHRAKSDEVEKNNKQGLKDAFKAFDKGLEIGKDDKKYKYGDVAKNIKNFHTKQLEIILKSLPKVELAEFIAQAYQQGNNLEVFDKLKIKYTDPAGVSKEATLKELKEVDKVNFDHSSKVVDLLTKGADGAKIDQFINNMFAYQGAKGDTPAEKLEKFKTFDDKAIADTSKPIRQKFESEKGVAYIEEKLSFTAKGSTSEEKLKHCQSQFIDHEMLKWKRHKGIAPVPSPKEPTGEKVGGIGPRGIVAAA